MFEDSEGMATGIKKLIAMRSEVGITAVSPVDVLNAEKNQYLADITGENGVVRIRMGRKEDVGEYTPKEEDGWEDVLADGSFNVWKRNS